MKRSVLLILLMSLFLINLVSAEEITIDYPEVVVFGEEFEVDVELIDFEDDVYDVKIDIKNSGNQRISEIWNGDDWQSTYNYVNDIIDISSSNSGVFRLNITEEYEGTANIEVKIRNSQGQFSTFKDYIVGITSEGGEEEKEEENNETEDNEKEGNEDEIKLEIDWDEDDITNGDEFEINVKAFNLKSDNYDIKIWIEFEDNDTVISDRYNEDEEAWNSGRYYIDDFFKGLGDKEEEITLRIRRDYDAYEGDAIIFVKLRDSVEINKSIEILEYKDEEEKEDEEGSSFTFLSDDEDDEETDVEEIEIEESKGTIYLGKATENLESEDIKSQDNILYESGIQQIKKFSIYAFALLCVILCILLFWNKF